VSTLEIIAAILGFANIVLLVRRSIWNYLFGLAMVALYAPVFFQAKLYSDAVLQLVFFATQLYGWWAWWRAGGAERRIEVARLTVPARAMWVIVVLLLSLAWGAMEQTYTDAAFPWWDAAVSVPSIAALILQARRCIENWILWIAVDLISVPLYLAKNLPYTAALYMAFLILCLFGLREWANAGRKAEAAA